MEAQRAKLESLQLSQNSMVPIFREVESIDREEAQKVFLSHNVAAIPETLVRITFHEADWRWVQGWCLHLINDTEPTVQKIAISCLGHLARIHGTLDKSKVTPALNTFVNDATLGEIVQDALDDIAVFVRY